MKNTQLISVNELRETFINYFVENGHTKFLSSSLVPSSDPSLLFTNSGMVQFKDIFMGNKRPTSLRVVTSQKCLRAGGKHNDLENVGYTARHHTFFEMLGNFSFGDYFKEEAIVFAWELLTKVLVIDPQKLIVTVYEEDIDAFNLWKKKIGISENRIIKIGDNKGSKYSSDNFWQMADLGPCGPCSEIFFDHGSHVKGGLPGTKEENGDRFVEIWNLVFMQFQKLESGELINLPNLSVDTGMGLERIAAVMQGVTNNYDIDLFKKLIAKITTRTSFKNNSDASLKVIADHIRASCFLMLDGVFPSSEGRGYVLRRIIRRALRHGNKLGQKKPFFSLLVDDLCHLMGNGFSELQEKKEIIASYLLEEEEKFNETLNRGIELLDNVLNNAKGNLLDGKTAFLLYDTYGFPVDLTADICREKGFNLDQLGFEREMSIQKEKARTSNKFKFAETFECSDPETNFVGYDTSRTEGTVISIFKNNQLVENAVKGEFVFLTLSQSCFYAESGGQVGDIGNLKTDSANVKITNTTKMTNNVYLHHGFIESGEIKVNQSGNLQIDEENRANIKRNHSATHLLHLALKKTLGDHVQQKGSLVNSERTRFDFSHPNILTNEQIRKVENIVNDEILENSKTSANLMEYADALKSGAVALFGEKYSDEVRVLTIGSSKELCGGTHVGRTGDIGFFKIVNETGVSSGVRRVEAVTGKNAFAYIQETDELVKQVSSITKTPVKKLHERVIDLLESNKKLEQQVEFVQQKWISFIRDSLIKEPKQFNEINIVAKNIEQVDTKVLRKLVDYVKSKISPVIVVLSTLENEKIHLIVGVSKDLSKKYRASSIVSEIAPKIDGKGGGRDDLAQAGGTKTEGLNEIIENFETILKKLYWS